MIDNVILLITGTLHQRAISELVPKCHPLGSFEQMEAVNIAQTPAELYNAILVDTPLGKTILKWQMNTWITFSLSFVARGSHWVVNLVIYCLYFFKHSQFSKSCSKYYYIAHPHITVNGYFFLFQLLSFRTASLSRIWMRWTLKSSATPFTRSALGWNIPGRKSWMFIRNFHMARQICLSTETRWFVWILCAESDLT